MENKVKMMIPKDLWLPSQPEVEEIVSSKVEEN